MVPLHLYYGIVHGVHGRICSKLLEELNSYMEEICVKVLIPTKLYIRDSALKNFNKKKK